MSPRLSSVDAELIRTLEKAFERHAGSDGLIDVADLQKALGLKSEYLTRRVLRAFDRDASGQIDSQEFLAAVRTLVFGGERERLEFAFRLHDDDDDGSISEIELLRMIAISLAENSVITRKSQPPDALAKAVFKAADTNEDGRVSFEEFAQVMQKYPELLRKITASEAYWIAPNEALLHQLTDGPNTTRRGLFRLLDNHRFDLLAIALWLTINVVLFVSGLRGPSESAAVPSARWALIGHALARCLNFNGALIFVPVLRHFIAWLRSTWLGRKLGVDEAIDVHRALGHVLFGLAWAHAAAYLLAYQGGHSSLGIGHLLTRTLRGGTGTLLLLVFSVLWVFALTPFRRSHRFELFFNTHRLYIAWIGLLVAHAPGFLVWAALPLLALVVELSNRKRRRGKQAVVHEIAPLRSGVTRLVIERPAAFRFQAGDYIFINLPEIAKHEWHPFTLSSPPEQSDLTIHVRCLGNWTEALRQAAEARDARGDTTPWLAHIDGPYGTPSANIFQARNAVLIGAGIGVTPFASVLGSIVARASGHSDDPSSLQNVHFFWLNRDQYSFEWFSAVLADLERHALHDVRVELHTCLTGARTGATSAALEIAREILKAEGKRDLVTGLHAKTHMGHPDWRIVLTAIADQHSPEPVEVFFCGPPGLGKILRAECAHIGLRFHEEKF
jgi:predicted ferric reductase/Ca2+-binding EF-hand superfamily protein